MTRTFLVVMSVVVGCAVSPSVLADIINVPADQPTIQAGIDAAVDGDEVVVGDGTYTGVGNRDMNFGGKAITVRSDNGAGACIIDIQGSDIDPHRAFTFQNGETAASVVEGFTIQNGFMDRGGAVLCEFGSDPLFQTCVFQQNTAWAESPFDGGGAVYSIGGSPTFNYCEFRENQAELKASLAGGGAVMITDGCEADAGCSRPVFHGCLFGGNTATVGGAVYVSSYAAEFVNCTFVGNQADQVGAIRVEPPSPGVIVVNCTFVGNQADQGGAISAGPGPATGVVVDNSILWNNSPEQIAFQVYVQYSDVQGSWEGEGNIDEDPLFVDPDGPDNDPDTWEDNDYRLLASSPCIDAANNNAIPKGSETDLDGNPRYIEDPNTPDAGLGDCPIVDMGSYEFQDGTTNCCVWDLDSDGTVGLSDLLELLAAWGPCKGCPADFDDDGSVGLSDLLDLLANWGPCP